MPKTSGDACQIFFDYIDVNFRNGAYSLSPVIPKKKDAEDSSIPMVTSLQLKSSYLHRESTENRVSAAEMIDRHLSSFSSFKRDSERLCHSWSKPICLSKEDSRVIETTSVAELVQIEVKESPVKTESNFAIKEKLTSPSKSPGDSPIQVRDEEIEKEEPSDHLDHLVSFRRYHEPRPKITAPERSHSEKISELRHKSFNREASKNENSNSRPKEGSMLSRNRRDSVHKFEITEDAEKSAQESPEKDSTASNRRRSTDFKQQDASSLFNSNDKSKKSNFMRVERELNFHHNRFGEKPGSVMIDLRETRKISAYDRRLDLGRSNANKFGVNLPNRIKYDNILQRPTDTVMKKFINLSQSKGSSNFGSGQPSRMFTNHGDNLRQQLYSNNGIRHMANAERKRQIGITSNLLLGTKADELLGRRPAFTGSSRWPSKLR